MMGRFTVKSGYIKLLSILLISSLGALVYSNSFLCSFHFDDNFFIIENSVIRNITQIQDIWDFLPARFLLYLSFAFNYHFHQLDVFGYHIFNLVVHLMSAILVWWFSLLTLSTPALKENKIIGHSHLIALFAGLIFVSHPVQTQAVTYIIQRAASMTTLFYLAALCFYVQSRLLQEKQSTAYGVRFFYGGACLMALMAMFTKEIAITLPIIFLFYEFSFLRGNKGINWKSLAPFLLMILVIPLTLFLFKAINAHELTNAVEGATDLSVTQYLLTQLRVLITYVRLLIVPYNQNLDYDYPVFNSFLEWPVIGGGLFLIAILYCVQRTFLNYRLISFFIGWFLITLLPESSFFSMKDVIFEHRLYLPMVGYSLFLVAGAYYLIGQKTWPVTVALLAVIVLSYSVLTYQRNFVWKDEFSLWDDVVHKSPGKARPYNNRGVAHFKNNNYTQAIADYSKAIELDPQYADAHNNLGSSYSRLGNATEALKYYQRALEIQPNDPEVYVNRGSTYLRRNDLALALADYNKAIDLNPNLAKAYANRGLVHDRQGRVDLAMKDYDKALAVDPGYLKTYINRATTYGLKGDMDKALSDFNRAMEINSQDVDVYRNRGIVYYKQNNFEQALVDYTKAIALSDNDAEIYYNRAIIYEKQGYYQQAIKDYNKAIEINSFYTEAYDSRGVVYDKQGQLSQAMADYTKALELNPKYAKAYNNRGIIYGKKGDLVQAIADFTRSIEIDPGNAEAFYNRGLASQNQGRLEDALLDYGRAIEINPRYADAYNGRGSVFIAQRKLDEAIADFNKTIEINPRFVGAYNNRGVIYGQKGNFSQAMSDFSKVIELNPESAEAFHNRGLIYYNQGQATEALADFNKAIDLIPNYTVAYSNRAMVYAQLKRYDEAWDDIHKAQTMGATINQEFLNVLKQNSGREM